MKLLAIIVLVVCGMAIGASLVFKPDEPRDCFYSAALKSCTWTHP